MNQYFKLLETAQQSFGNEPIHYWIFGQFTFCINEEEYSGKGIIAATGQEVFFYSEVGDKCFQNSLTYEHVNLFYNEEECLNELRVKLDEENAYAKIYTIPNEEDSKLMELLKRRSDSMANRLHMN